MKHTIHQVFVYIFPCMRIYDKFYLGHRSILFYYLGFSINRLNVQFYLDCAKFCTAVLCQRCTCNRIMCNEITITLRTYIATRSQKLNTRPTSRETWVVCWHSYNLGKNHPFTAWTFHKSFSAEHMMLTMNNSLKVLKIVELK